MQEYEKTLIGAANRIADSLGSVEKIAESLGGGGLLSVAREAFAYPGEEIFILHGVANGKVRADGRGINVSADLWTMNGEHIATKVLNAQTSAKTMEDLLRVPANPKVDLEDQTPVEEIQPTTLKKAKWTFKDGSTITAIGKGVSHIWQLKDGSTVNADAALMIVTNGTGRYEGAQGIASTEGITFTPAGNPNPFANPGGPLRNQHTIEVFKLSRGALVKR
jgi:hypothetical protein